MCVGTSTLCCVSYSRLQVHGMVLQQLRHLSDGYGYCLQQLLCCTCAPLLVVDRSIRGVGVEGTQPHGVQTTNA
jgi:hypothetical protein